jgi:hypothetical protein
MKRPRIHDNCDSYYIRRDIADGEGHHMAQSHHGAWHNCSETSSKATGFGADTSVVKAQAAVTTTCHRTCNERFTAISGPMKVN